jgi:diguanylate cyclase (GGDEF)-like protein
MSGAGKFGRTLVLGALLLLGFQAMAARAADAESAATDNPVQMLEHADQIKTSDHAQFLRLLAQLNQHTADLLTDQQWKLRYLQAWETAYEGHYDEARPDLTEVINQSGNAALKMRAMATLVNILGISRHYEDAFTRLSMLIDALPAVKDAEARYQALGEAAQFLTFAGQYELASSYAQKILDDTDQGTHICQGLYFKIHALSKSGALKGTDALLDQGIDACHSSKQELFANAIRADRASYAISQGHAADAIKLLQAHYDEALSTHYPAQIATFDVLLARAYWEIGDMVLARKFAEATVVDAVKDPYSEALSQAYQVLYKIEDRQGNARDALGFHEKYMEADKGYLTDVSARAIAYQTVKQQLLANKVQVDSLNKQNEILQLQRKLDHKDMETSRLYIALLLTVVASIALWLLRIKRSQMRFRRLATRDSLTGIHSRQHFVDETELALRAAAKATRTSCLILLDLDHFKDVNDTHGHVIGDLVLKRAVAACQHHLHRRDIFGRLGGEEFALYLPDCSASQARERAERIRQAIAATPLWGETRNVVITSSFGVASTDRSGYELRQLMIDADNALYQAKREGRNRVIYGEHAEVIVPTTVPAAEPPHDHPIEGIAGLPS